MSLRDKYILNSNGEPVLAGDLNAWSLWFEKADAHGLRRVAETELPDGRWISTVFLGLDHNFNENGPPILWETIVFGPKTNRRFRETLDLVRCAGSREQAEAMHQEMCQKLNHATA